MVEYVVILAVWSLGIVLPVLFFCGWLVTRTGSAESLKYVPPILRALFDLVRLRRRP